MKDLKEGNKRIICVTLPPDLVKKIDQKRGLAGRSAYVGMLLEKSMEMIAR
jgi:metal-responsive CopG/Arc/MetJ family transcriptional regulator